MANIYIFGMGQGLAYIQRCIYSDVKILAYIDNYSTMQYAEDGIAIVGQEEVIGTTYDYILISLMNYEDVREKLVEHIGVERNKIICFFDQEDVENNMFYEILDFTKWKTELLWKYQREVVQPFIYNQFYENNEERLLVEKKIPKIIEPLSSLQHLIEQKSSLVRFGDGEFELMRNRKRSKFQDVDERLALRLKSIIKEQRSDLMIAIADNYGNLDKYTDKAAEAIRLYLSPDVRKQHMQYLDFERNYYDAYLSRPYLMYRDKKLDKMMKKFQLIKSIWDGRDVLIVEGKHTRFGIGNDLLDNAKDVKRILAPDNNAFLKYDEILKKSAIYGKGKLVLCVLGPTATVLAYDLAIQGYWAIDIGQLDTEYEWFLRGTEDYCDIPYKTVSDYVSKSAYSEMCQDFQEEYRRQIICTID